MIINRRSKRIFFEHKAFYIGMLLLIIFSTSLYLSMKTAATSIKNSVAQDRIKSNVEDANFIYSKVLTVDEIKKLENKYSLILQESKYKDIEYNGAIVRVRPDYKKLNIYSVYDGKGLKNSNDILVDRFFFTSQKLRFGDILVLNNASYNVSGILSTPDYLSMLKSEADFMANGLKFGLAVVDESAYMNIEGSENILYSVKFNAHNEEEFRKELSQGGLVVSWTDSDHNIRIAPFNGEIDAIIMMSDIAPLFIMFVSCFIMAVVVGRMLKKEYSYIGTMAAMGYKKCEILSHYLRLPIIVSITGSVIGLIAGYFLAEPMEVLSKLEYSIPAVKLEFKWQNVLTAILLPLVLNISAAAFSIFKALNINIVLLLKPSSSKQKIGLLTRLIPYNQGSFKFRYRLKEILCNIPRSTLMFIGIATASLFMLSGFILDSSLKFLFDSSFDKVYKYEYQYIYNAPRFDNQAEGEPFMLSLFDYTKDGKTNSVTLTGIEEDSKYIKLLDDKGNVIPNNKTVVSKSVAKKLGLEKGDIIILRNRSDLKQYTISIDEITNINFGENIYMGRTNLNKMLGLPANTYIGI